MDIKIIFGIRLKHLRELKKLTQEQIAEKSNMDRSYISQLERGLKSVSLEKL